jgi:hypothetical protein
MSTVRLAVVAPTITRKTEPKQRPLEAVVDIVILHDNEPRHVRREAHRSATNGGAFAEAATSQ